MKSFRTLFTFFVISVSGEISRRACKTQILNIIGIFFSNGIDERAGGTSRAHFCTSLASFWATKTFTLSLSIVVLANLTQCAIFGTGLQCRSRRLFNFQESSNRTPFTRRQTCCVGVLAWSADFAGLLTVALFFTVSFPNYTCHAARLFALLLVISFRAAFAFG